MKNHTGYKINNLAAACLPMNLNWSICSLQNSNTELDLSIWLLKTMSPVRQVLIKDYSPFFHFLSACIHNFILEFEKLMSLRKINITNMKTKSTIANSYVVITHLLEKNKTNN